MKYLMKLCTIVIFFTAIINSFCNTSVSELGTHGALKAIGVQADGKILGAGYTKVDKNHTFTVVRHHPDGTLDTSFGSGGKVVTKFGANETHSGAQALIVQADGKIVVGGFSNAVKNMFRFCLARYNSNGTLDKTFFGGRGIVPGTVITDFGPKDTMSQINALTIQMDGKIIAVGTSMCENGACVALARYNQDGSLDKEFNAHGASRIPGTVCLDFGSSDMQHDEGRTVAVTNQGKIIIGGSSYTSGVQTFALARLLPDGSFDRSFFGGGLAKKQGTVITSFGCGETESQIRTILIQSDDKIVAAGYSNSNNYRAEGKRFALARYDAQGNLDASFGDQDLATLAGTMISSFDEQEESLINSLVMQQDGKLIAVGNARIEQNNGVATARYLPNGAVDFLCVNHNEHNKSQTVGGETEQLYGAALQADGSLVSVGTIGISRVYKPLLTRSIPVYDSLTGPTINTPYNGSVLYDGSAIKVSGDAQNPGIIHIYNNGSYVGSTHTKGIHNEWNYQLSPLKNGTYCIEVQQRYDAGNVILKSPSCVTITIDQTPVTLDLKSTTCGMQPCYGMLEAKGASGFYSYSILFTTNGQITLNGDCFSFVPSIASGQASFDYLVTDLITNATAKGRYVINVQEKPKGSCIQQSTSLNIPLHANLGTLIPNLRGPITFGLVDEVQHGIVQLQPNGTFEFIPDKDFVGNAQFAYQIVDQYGFTSDPETVAISITKPPFLEQATFHVYEGMTVRHNLDQYVSQGNPPFVFTQKTHPTIGTLGIKKNGSLMYKAPQGFSGELSFEYQVTDANKAVSNIGKATLMVHPLPIAQDASFSVAENTMLRGNLSHLISRGVPEYRFVQIGDMRNGSLQLNTDGSFVFTPNPDFSGTTSFEYKVEDRNNVCSNAARIEIQVNEQPRLSPGMLGICQNKKLNGDLSTLVTKGNPPYNFAPIGTPVNGSLVIHENGTFVFIPSKDFSGQASFTYQVTDEHKTVSDIGTVTIEVYEKAGTLPTKVVTYRNSPVTLDLNKQIVGGTAPYIFKILTVDSRGDAIINEAGILTFTPESTFVGFTQIEYEVTDANNCSNKGTVLIEIYTNVQAHDYSVQIYEDTLLVDNLIKVVESGTPPYEFSFKDTQDQDLICDKDGSFIFKPQFGFDGDISLTYHVSDLLESSQTAQLKIHVVKKPRAANGKFIAPSQQALQHSLQKLVNHGIAPYSFKQVGKATNGSVAIEPDGNFSFTVTEQDKLAQFEYAVTDANGYESNTASVIVFINKFARDSNLFVVHRSEPRA